MTSEASSELLHYIGEAFRTKLGLDAVEVDDACVCSSKLTKRSEQTCAVRRKQHLKLVPARDRHKEISESRLKIGMDVGVGLINEHQPLRTTLNVPDGADREDVERDRQKLRFTAAEVVDVLNDLIVCHPLDNEWWIPCTTQLRREVRKQLRNESLKFLGPAGELIGTRVTSRRKVSLNARNDLPPILSREVSIAVLLALLVVDLLLEIVRLIVELASTLGDDIVT
jgi:hypothetical protein